MYKHGSKSLFIILLGVCFSVFCHAQSIVTNNQLLWQISGNGLKKPSYLYGSYHSNDSRIFKLSDSTYSALMNAEAVVLEADIYQLFSEYDIRLERSKIKFDSQGNPYTSDHKATKTRYGSEDGRPQFLDLYFQQIAYNMNKAFFPLETIEEQLEAYESVYERTPTQKSLEQLKIIQDNLMNAYLRGDIEYVRNLIQQQLNDSQTAYDRLIIRRNVNMAVGIDTLCRQKSLFVAVGAGHLAGNEGVIQLLRKKGYHVRQVVASYSPQKTEAELKLQQFNSYTYVNRELGFKAIFGGKPIRDTNEMNFRLIYQEMGQGNTYIIEVEDLTDANLAQYVDEVIMPPEKSKILSLKHQGLLPAYEGIGYEYAVGLSWKRVFVYQDKLIKLICYGGNKFMNSNRPAAFFNKVEFEVE